MTRFTCLAVAVAGLTVARSGLAGDEDIRMSSIGYHPDRTKVASITQEADTFVVKDASDEEIVFEGTLAAPIQDEPTGVLVQLADFSDVQTPGIYYLEVDGVGRSRPFPISEDVYYEALRTAMLGFYGMRSGIDISIVHGGETFSHAAGHLDDGYLDYLGEEGVFKDGVGGWYDAGDYGKYMVNGSFAVGQVMAAWDDFSDVLETVDLQVPEQGDDVPDFLDEIRYQVEWVLKMQFEDGSVSHKLSAERFTSFILPEFHTETRYFAPVSTAAAADFMAVTSMASRLFRPYDEAFADRCLEAATLSYDYLKANPENMGADLTGFHTGSYQTDDADDRLWAAAEYWETTGDAAALEDVELRISEWSSSLVASIFDWQEVANLGMFTYLRGEREGRDPALVTRIEEAVISAADSIVATAAESPFGRGIGGFWWGSNGTVARTCLVLQTAKSITGDTNYLDKCAEQIGYLYGRNLYGRSQVTGEGLLPPCNPHDRRSGGDDVRRPYPGLLVGGGSNPRNWVDEEGSFETNEVAINWNGALVYGLAGLALGDGIGSAVGFEPEFDDCSEQAPPPPDPPSKGLDGEPVLIDDFEDGDEWILETGGRRGMWRVEDDGTGTNEGYTTAISGHDGIGRAMYIYATGYTGWGGRVGCDLNDTGSGAMPYDATEFSGISFYAKGTNQRTFTLEVLDNLSTYTVEFEVSSVWQQYLFAWDELSRFDPSQIKSLQFRWGSNRVYELFIDDLAFATPTGYVADKDRSSGDAADAGPDGSTTNADSPNGGAMDGTCGCSATGKQLKGAFELLRIVLGW